MTEHASTGSASTNRPARVFVVDDHPLVRRGLKDLIDSQPDLEFCGEAESVTGGMQAIVGARPDVAVIDISLKDGSGIELIKQIKARCPQVKLLVSSMHRESLYGERALKAGAMGYVSKNEASEALIEAIRQVMRGKIYVSDAMVDQVLGRVAHGERSIETSAIDALSDRELEVLELIGQGETTRQIASKLHLSVKTIETYRENIKRKLNLKNSAELSCYAAQWTMNNA